MRKIFLDCGTNLGQGFKQFIQMGKITSDTEVYSFEPNPYCPVDDNSLIKIANELQVNPQVKFYRVAVFDSNGTKSIVVENNDKTGQGVCISDIGNVSTPNFMAKGAHFVDVKTIRLTNFIEELSLNNDDELRIKIDIEGSEYHVLLDMLDNFKLWSALKEIWVEWHDRLFMSNELTSKRSYIEASFEKNGVKITPWY